ncbi:MAG: NAD-dependent dihydropyrimidine dehydrogenase subunit PreA [candidate division Zixibacteria bacterium]|nr:NAD-dependent dihydropyrimidine dehydrogenase subunit PreA [candidate division Zixibacteria bacterium]
MIYTSDYLRTEFLGITLENPFILSAAPSTDELSITRRGLQAGWAGVVLKTTSHEKMEVRLTYPMMSAFYDDGRLSGMGNIDLISAYHINEICERVSVLKKEFPNKMIAASMMSDSKEGWQSTAKALVGSGVDLIECSFSCPQGSAGEDPGKMLAQNAEATQTAASWVKETTGDIPVLIKITPMVTDIVAIAKAVKNSGADGLTASNSIPALMGVDIETLTPVPSLDGYSTYSGLTGSAIKPVTLRTVAEISKGVPGFPISGNGGIGNWKDAVEILAVGASNVQICTAVMLEGFGIIEDLCSGLENYIMRKKLSNVSTLVGKALDRITEHSALPLKNPKSRINQETCINCGKCFISCRDGGHEAIEWNRERRLPQVNLENCVGCALCKLVCPVIDCIAIDEYQ